nr:MAG TPA: hypothetical protein [Caudoviricetes sp.]
MFDLRTYSDVLFRVDEVMSDKYGEWLKFDDRFFTHKMILIGLFWRLCLTLSLKAQA